MNDIDWLKRNRRFLNISEIAKETKIEGDIKHLSIRTLTGYVKGQSDGHGTPFTIPAKYQEQLKKVIKSIRKP